MVAMKAMIRAEEIAEQKMHQFNWTTGHSGSFWDDFALLNEEQQKEVREALKIGIGLPEFTALQDNDAYPLAWLEQVQLGFEGVSDRTKSIYEIFIDTCFEAKFSRKLKLLPICTGEGKIRVATIHDRKVVWAARALTNCLLPLLRDRMVTREQLKGISDPIYLRRGKEGSLLYSADLSKSTDPISVQLSRFVIEELRQYIEEPEWFQNAFDAVINNQQLIGVEGPDLEFENREINCGALMGLGPGWVVLNILNAFCADRAGVDKEAFKVCGDDLIGLFTPRQARLYQHTIDLLGLKSNLEKSYFGDNGVFCEKFAKMTPDGATIYSRTRLGELAGTRTDFKRRLAIVESLQRYEGKLKYSALERLRKRTIRYSLANRNMPGKIRHGGGGVKQADAWTVIAYVRFGGLPSKQSETSAEYADLRKQLKQAEATSSGVPMRDVLTARLCDEELLRRYSDGAPTREAAKKSHGPYKTSQLARIARTRRAWAKSQGSSPIEIMRGLDSEKTFARLTGRLRKQIINDLRFKKFNRALARVEKSWSACVSTVYATSTLDAINAANTQHVSPVLGTGSPAPRAWDKTPANG